MRELRAEDAVGQVLCHDVTRIVRGETKGPAFRRGHVIRREDLPLLLSIGKEHVYVWEPNEDSLHEDDAARILCELCIGEYMHASDISEGKIELIADIDGLLKVDREKLSRVNGLGEMMIASRHGDFPVRTGDKLAGMRVIPLVIEREKMERARAAAAGGQIFRLLPFQHRKIGIITTGSEVYHGRIEDTFTPVLLDKLSVYAHTLVGHIVTDDDPVRITAAIRELLRAGAQFVICTGGMSVDPDDKTPRAIRETGARIVSYGAPVLPGAMFLLAYYGEQELPIVGLPGCVMYARRTIFDLILPRLMACDPVTARELSLLGEGGLCLGCEVCRFPDCGFGR